MQVIKITLFSVVIIIVCAIIFMLQNYILICPKHNKDIKFYIPVFEDMIVDDNENNILSNGNQWQPNHFKLLNSLDQALKTSLPVAADSTTVISRNSSIITDSEIYNSLQAALSFKMAGKMGKALKLFKHALTIAPENPDVLNRYGEFIEDAHNDIIKADELYFKALTHSPGHRAALINRKRTADIVDQLDLKIFKIIDEKRDLLKKIQEENPAYDVLKRQAYYLHIYHTVGIEGNTFTLDQLISLLETKNVVYGKSIVEHNEILGLELAMKYIKILTGFTVIGLNEILGIHRRIIGHVDPLRSGIFRNTEVFVGSHIPPPPENLQALMESYVEWLNSDEAQSMHPVRFAALAHYKLVEIHPFFDGNGRTSRLVMNLILLKAGYPPVIILKQYRERYYHYLKIANQGDVRPFVRFIAYCTERVLTVYLTSADKLYSEIEHVKSTTIEIDEHNRNI